eukprot:196915_1
MSHGVVTPATATSFTLNTIFLLCIIALSVKSIRTKENVWKGSKTNKHIQIFTTATLSFYASAVLVSWIFFLEIMTIGYDVDAFDVIPTTTLLFFTLLFFIGLILTLYIWIQRAQCAFQSTEYVFNPTLIKFVQIMFWAICIVGGSTLIIYVVSQIRPHEVLPLLRKVLGGGWALMFATEICVILFAYISRLSQLKKTCGVLVKAFDRGVAETMTKLTALQIKLSILMIMMIVGTFLCILLAIVLEDYIQFLPLSLNAFVGFISIYCSIPGHRNAYGQMCGMCLWCCMKYAQSYDELMVLYDMCDGEEVKSKSDGVVDATKPSVALITSTTTKEELKAPTPVSGDTSANDLTLAIDGSKSGE